MNKKPTNDMIVDICNRFIIYYDNHLIETKRELNKYNHSQKDSTYWKLLDDYRQYDAFKVFVTIIRDCAWDLDTCNDWYRTFKKNNYYWFDYEDYTDDNKEKK